LAASAQAPCASIYTVTGSSCADLKVSPNLTRCDDRRLRGAVQTECSGEKATAKFATGSQRFVADLEMAADGWGKKAWKVTSLKATAVTAPPAAARAAPEPAPVAAAQPAPAEAVASQAAAPAPAVAAPETSADRVVAQAAEPKADERKVEVAAYLDVQAQHNLNGRSTTGARYFNETNNRVILNTAELTTKISQGPVQFRLDIAAGAQTDKQDAVEIDTTQTPAVFKQDALRHFNQATVTYTPPISDRISITAGKFPTHIGYELTRAKDNAVLTGGLLFSFGVPLNHIGASVTGIVIPDMLTSTVYVMNGWESRLNRESNNNATIGANITGSPIKGLTLVYNLISGVEGTDQSQLRTLHEVIATYKLLDSLDLAVDYVMASQTKAVSGQDAKWSGLLLTAKYQLLESLALVGRYEIFDDSDQGFAVGGYAGAGTKQKLTNLSFGMNLDLGGGLETRFEARQVKSDVKSSTFKDKDGADADSETTMTWGLLLSI
jgi:hypothetical protein